jgi:hypothetical protein
MDYHRDPSQPRGHGDRDGDVAAFGEHNPRIKSAEERERREHTGRDAEYIGYVPPRHVSTQFPGGNRVERDAGVGHDPALNTISRPDPHHPRTVFRGEALQYGQAGVHVPPGSAAGKND